MYNYKQREKFIQNLRENVSTYKTHLRSDNKEKAKIDAEMIKKDWEKVVKTFPENEK